MNMITIGRQPLIDPNGDTQAYEWFFRQSVGQSLSAATSHLIMTLVNQAGMDTVMEADVVFLNLDIRLLATGLVQMLPKHKFVFDIPSATQLRTQDIEMISYLHKEGYRFSLDNIELEDGWEERLYQILPMIEFLKIDISSVSGLNWLDLSPYKSTHKLVAHKIENQKQFEMAKKFGFELFQGYYIAKPELKTYPNLPIMKRSVLELYKLIQADVDIRQLAVFFTQQIDIGFTFLEFFSNLKLEYEDNITSFYDALKAMGKKQVMDWTLMLIYSKIGIEKDPEVEEFYTQIEIKIEQMLNDLEDDKTLAVENRCDSHRFIAMMILCQEIVNRPLGKLLQESMKEVIKS